MTQTVSIRQNMQCATLAGAVLTLPFSISLCHWALTLYVLLWATEGRWKQKYEKFRSNTSLRLWALFAALLLIGMIYTDDKVEGWSSLEKKVFLFLMPLTLGTSTTQFSERQITSTLFAFVFACLVASVVCLHNSFQALSFPQSEWATRLNVVNSVPAETNDQWVLFSYTALARGVGMHPAYLSMYLTFAVVFLLVEFEKAYPRAVKILLGIIIIFLSLFIVSLASRVMIFNLLIILITFASLFFLNTKLGSKVWLPAVVIFLSIAMLYVNPVSRYKNLQEIGQTFSLSSNGMANSTQTSTQIRASLLWVSWRSLAEINLLSGAGTGDVTGIMKHTSEKYGITNMHNTYNPHNQYLFILMALGVPGLLIFVSCLVLPLAKAIRHRNYLLLSFIFLFGMLCLSETVLERQKGVAFFSIFFSLLVFHKEPIADRKGTSHK